MKKQTNHIPLCSGKGGGGGRGGRVGQQSCLIVCNNTGLLELINTNGFASSGVAVGSDTKA